MQILEYLRQPALCMSDNNYTKFDANTRVLEAALCMSDNNYTKLL